MCLGRVERRQTRLHLGYEPFSVHERVSKAVERLPGFKIP